MLGAGLVWYELDWDELWREEGEGEGLVRTRWMRLEFSGTKGTLCLAWRSLACIVNASSYVGRSNGTQEFVLTLLVLDGLEFRSILPQNLNLPEDLV